VTGAANRGRSAGGTGNLRVAIRQCARDLEELDRELFNRAAGWHTPALDAVLPRLSRAADHSKLWIGLSVPIALTGPRGRRAAVRGLASLGVASAVTNIAAKLVFRRPRPEFARVPRIRRIRKQPASSSFPSGHSASAAAFATGVALELPALGIPVGALAAAVAYSRVHTGVHYPGDVLAGVAIGTGLALAGRALFPAHPTTTPETSSSAGQPTSR
jgi:membrane-associated phospholipid phosphatase